MTSLTSQSTFSQLHGVLSFTGSLFSIKYLAQSVHYQIFRIAVSLYCNVVIKMYVFNSDYLSSFYLACGPRYFSLYNYPNRCWPNITKTFNLFYISHYRTFVTCYARSLSNFVYDPLSKKKLSLTKQTLDTGHPSMLSFQLHGLGKVWNETKIENSFSVK